MEQFKLTYKPYGKHAILIEWPARIDKNILSDIINFKNKIIQNNIKVILDIINTYNSLTIIYNNSIENTYNEILRLKSIYLENVPVINKQNYRWYIPVCYDEVFGIDLAEISKSKNTSQEEIIKLHTQSIYTVYFIGFLPGFLYLGGMHEKLFMPRKATPRFTIDEGSVAIGGSQTGVYPAESAGGWNIIGRSPISFFDSQAQNPCFASPKDEIVFEKIITDEYYVIRDQVSKNCYNLKHIPIYD